MFQLLILLFRSHHTRLDEQRLEVTTSPLRIYHLLQEHGDSFHIVPRVT